MYYSPELILGLSDYVDSYWFKAAVNYTPAIVFDLFQDSMNASLTEFTEYLILFVFFA